MSSGKWRPSGLNVLSDNYTYQLICSSPDPASFLMEGALIKRGNWYSITTPMGTFHCRQHTRRPIKIEFYILEHTLTSLKRIRSALYPGEHTNWESTTLEEYEKNGLTHCGPVTPYEDIYLGQFWLNQWPSLVKFGGIHQPIAAKDTNLFDEFGNYTPKITATSPIGQWVKCDSNPKSLTHRDCVFVSYSITLAWVITCC